MSNFPQIPGSEIGRKISLHRTGEEHTLNSNTEIISPANKIMNAYQEAEKLLSEMTRAEKAQLLQWVVRDLGDSFPGIESNPHVSGGEACIVRTRIPVWLLEQARRLGTSEAELLRSYTSLRAEDLANAWAYVRSHREEIELQIAENEEA
ncbi:MAG: DUF433 domain-containing protein [bacterium]